ncbi:uncharacterized protein LTR77_009800 [Saxophila tyrrhenica]|uniref:Uncharacterized protein n=1 Tax=Saxophila tyrrhenica TaxID=1690608 RepID=A0AAV9NXB6_9PEZI|nr:hypothetical protein LTR77_009800 [Saxophila tyrrhenica]
MNGSCSGRPKGPVSKDAVRRDMDKFKGIAKGGWHPSGDRPISRETWKSDVKGIATGKKKDPYEDARNHQSAPLTSLKDPDSFGAPPKHAGSFGSTPATPSSPARPQQLGGWGSVVPASTPRQQQKEEEEVAKEPSGPYRTDTTGLRTDNLPRPPGRRDGAVQAPPTPPRQTSMASPPPALPTRQSQSRQPQSRPPQAAQAPAPYLPPRMTENPDEFTPPPPPTYNEATQPEQRDPASLNTGAINRLGQAGVSVPGFGIGSNSTGASSTQSPTITGHTGQLSELQQRFSRMNTGSQNQAPSPSSNNTAAAAAQKKPPPPPPKKAGLGNGNNGQPSSSGAGSAPPPLPMSSKPRPPT